MANLSEQLETLFNKLCTLANNINDIIEEAYKIKGCYSDENNNEDEEPIAYCDNCCEAIWDEKDIVEGDYGQYCCDECREEAEEEEEDEEPVAYCANCGAEIWDEDEIIDGYEGEYCSEDCRAEAEEEDEYEDEEEDEE